MLAVPAINPASRADRHAELKVALEPPAPPVLANDFQTRQIGLTQQHGQQLVSRLSLVERGDQGLLDRHRSVKRLEVAPRFEAMGFGNMPLAELGRLIVIQAEVDAKLDLVALQQPCEPEVRRGIVDRVSSQNDQRVDQSGVRSR